MSSTAIDIIARADEVIPGTLAEGERRRISKRLGTGLVGLGLLALGTLLVRFARPQRGGGKFSRALAAVVVEIPTLISGVRGIVPGDPRRATDQLVSIAVFAS